MVELSDADLPEAGPAGPPLPEPRGEDLTLPLPLDWPLTGLLLALLPLVDPPLVIPAVGTPLAVTLVDLPTAPLAVIDVAGLPLTVLVLTKAPLAGTLWVLCCGTSP